MASIANDPNGRKRILFAIAPKRRRTIYLGPASDEHAQDVRFHVENILEYRNGGPGARLNRDTSRWVESIPDDLHAKLAGVGLLESREATSIETLADLLKAFEDQLVVKAGTKTTYQQAMSGLRKHIGERTRLTSIGPAVADRWRKALTDEGLAPATIAKRIKVARAIFGKGVLWKAIAANPFSHIKSGSQANSARSFYIPRLWLPPLFEACPSDEWRAIIGLSRLAGLRCPSEIALLTWGSIDWDKGLLRVQSPKTAGHDGQDERFVPIVPRLYAILERLYHAADEGAVAVVPSVRDASVNLRTGFERIIARAGLKAWPRLFHNMRASCATDWLGSPGVTVRDVSEWLGHSPVTAATHYWQPRESAIQAVTGRGQTAHQTAQQGAELVGMGVPAGGESSAFPADSSVCNAVPTPEQKPNDPSGIRTRVATVKG